MTGNEGFLFMGKSGQSMMPVISIGNQDFESIRINHAFYIDKTLFIKEWWESQDDVTLITRPRRFGKTLNMGMVEQFFSNGYADRADLFEGLDIWKDEKCRKMQGNYPVIALSFADIKGNNYETVRDGMAQVIIDINTKFSFLLNGKNWLFLSAACLILLLRQIPTWNEG